MGRGRYDVINCYHIVYYTIPGVIYAYRYHKHMYNRCIDWPVVWAIETSDLDQVFSRHDLHVAQDEVHHSVCCLLVMPYLCSSLLTMPGAASAVLASSPGHRCCFPFSVKIFADPKRLFVCISTYQSGSTYRRHRVGWQVGLCACALRVDVSNPAWRFFFCVPLSPFYFCWRHLYC